VEGPSTQITPLQVACVFEYTEDDIFKSPPALPAALNGMLHLDQALKGIVMDIRKSGKFSPELMISVAGVAMQEATRLGITSYAFASDLKDAGIDSPTALVAGYVVKGSIEAYRTLLYLKSKKMAAFKPVTKITLLAGPSFFAVAGEGIKQAITRLNN
jgi:hypothetical protein